ncbi:unnamed protein product [Closterium sp. Yama58-4]|nr:unnamed protein product [Closterium sp. Yama58-4]
MEPGTDPEMEPGMAPGMDLELEPGMAPGMDLETEPGMGNPKRMKLMDPGMRTAGTKEKRMGSRMKLKRSDGKRGNRYIISAMDHFTKWPECKAVKRADSETAAAFVAERIISTHGCPLVIHTDNGQHFHGEFGVLLEKFGIYHEFSRPDHPQSSGLIERFQRTLKGALNRLGETNPFEWDEDICWVLLGYRASIHASTKFSPFYLLYGRHPNITGSTLTEWEVKELTELSTEEEADAAARYIYDRSSEMELALAKAAENHGKAQEKQKADFDRRRTLLEPIRVGDFIRIKPNKRVAWADQNQKYKTLFRVKEVEAFHVVVEAKGGVVWRESRENVKVVPVII